MFRVGVTEHPHFSCDYFHKLSPWNNWSKSGAMIFFRYVMKHSNVQKSLYGVTNKLRWLRVTGKILIDQDGYEKLQLKNQCNNWMIGLRNRQKSSPGSFRTLSRLMHQSCMIFEQITLILEYIALHRCLIFNSPAANGSYEIASAIT